MKKRVLALLADGVEEMELITPVDVLRRAGAEVVLAVVGNNFKVAGRNAIILYGDVLLENVKPETFDLLLLPGGPAVTYFRKDGSAAGLARYFADAGKWVAAICAAPLILADAGLLEGRRFTAHFSVVEELPEAQIGERVVEDGQIITARGAGVALEFGMALVDQLFGESQEEKIARSIMA